MPRVTRRRSQNRRKANTMGQGMSNTMGKRMRNTMGQGMKNGFNGGYHRKSRRCRKWY